MGQRRIKYGVYDIEWTPSLEVMFIGYVDRGRKEGFFGVEEFLDFAVVSGVDVIFAHSGGKYDILFLIHALKKRGYKMEGFFSGVSLVGLTVSTPHGKVKFADSVFLIASSVAKLGEWVGLPKLDFDHTKKHRPEKYYKYCIRDCEIVFKALEKFESTINELGVSMKMTVGSTAMSLARNAGGVYPLHGGLDRKLSRAYYGGRVEDILKGDHENCFFYDINSAYPWAMCQAIPGPFKGVSKREPKEKPWFVRATNVKVGGRHPPIPIRMKEGLYYPQGMLPEVIMSDVEAEQTNGYSPLMYYKFQPNRALTELVEALYKKRLEGGASSLVYKILLNSMYGKFAEKPEKEAMIINPAFPEEEYITVSPGVYRVPKYMRVAHRNIATAAYITALVRGRLREYMDKSTIYVDTDGFWTTRQYAESELTDGLGGIKLEKQAERLTILQPKVYRYDETVVAKGYRNLSSDQFDELRKGETVELEPQLHRVKGMLRRGLEGPTYRENMKQMHWHVPKRAEGGRAWFYAELQKMRNDLEGD